MFAPNHILFQWSNDYHFAARTILNVILDLGIPQAWFSLATNTRRVTPFPHYFWITYWIVDEINYKKQLDHEKHQFIADVFTGKQTSADWEGKKAWSVCASPCWWQQSLLHRKILKVRLLIISCNYARVDHSFSKLRFGVLNCFPLFELFSDFLAITVFKQLRVNVH